ncbi:hypothetical protein OSH11_05710 [Kaistia dalseonensis]|uniref:Uncharacterized protein n=1 Tax=Kaistia dalseonensis TaxID=410840 RepID=A0ABU0H4T5_9HYPH|nr:hypothetical protein [Kaistia dalseonensis]MCX5494186.1 hypothetical protein [Kaistia dalseonensis]MDQ0436765.1 hypothetical protein [Kaistia dalseonensis]
MAMGTPGPLPLEIRLFKSWLNLTMLTVESQQVIWLRTMKMALGGQGAEKEAMLMVTEKVEAAIHSGNRLLAGHSSDAIVKSYRSKVRANIRRLSKD